MAQGINYGDRLKEISEMKFSELSDEEVLRLLAERKHLEEKEKEYIEQEKKESHQKELQEEKRTVEEKLSKLNKLISPDKPDDELLHLIKERKELEVRIDTLSAEIGSALSGKDEPILPPAVEAVVSQVKVDDEHGNEEKKEEDAPVSEEKEKEVETTISVPKEEDFGNEQISSHELSESSNLWRYFEQIKNNPNSLGAILDQVPESARRDKSFMLAVATVDPAYAMHYADVVLKKDEDFNIKIASMKNERNTGNALAEMLPEARTSRVILAATRQDYKNVRFALPQMEEYDQILEIGKKGTLDMVKKLKDGVDISLLIPKILQKDASFMEQVNAIVDDKK